MSGYALIHRRLLGHHAFRNDAEAMAFGWMVIRASWKPARVRYKDRILNVGRGQLAVSVRDMAAAMDRDKAWIERLWKRLKSETMIETVTEKGVTLVTICNYDTYQASQTQDETRHETRGEISARQGRDTEQYREEVKENKRPAPKRERSPDFDVPDWIPSEPWAAFCQMRKRKKAPVDSYVATRLFTKLERISADGWDVAKVLDKSTVNRWTDVYPPTPGRDDDLRANRAANDAPTKPMTDAERAAYLEKLGGKPWANATPRAEQQPPRKGNTGPPRSIGQLAAGIAGNA